MQRTAMQRDATQRSRNAMQRGAMQYNAAQRHREGRGCKQSHERAAEWYGKAARQGYSNAQTMLGSYYAYGEGVPQSYEKAVELWKQSAAQGNPVRQRDQAKSNLQALKQTLRFHVTHPRSCKRFTANI